MKRLFIILAALASAALACNLGSDEPRQATVPVIPTALPTAFFTIPTATLMPTAFITATPAPTQINCTPYTAWPTYTVVAGDTLGQIAQRAGTTTEQLVAANCLVNAELIYVGQRLYVPRVPVTVTPAATITPTYDPNLPLFGQALSADQHWFTSTGQAITYLPTVRVTVGVVQNALLVDFYVNDPSSSAAISIGQDNDPWDGAFVDYDFPAPGVYTFQAAAQNEAKRATSTVFTITYDPNFVPSEGRYNTLTITPYVQASGGWLTLAAGATVTVSWRDAPVGATRIDFTLAPTGTGSVAQVIGSDLSPADGAIITWSVPGGITAHVQANATMPGGTIVSSDILNVVSP